MIKNIMIRAWELRRAGALRFNCKTSEINMSECMKMAWAESRICPVTQQFYTNLQKDTRIDTIFVKGYNAIVIYKNYTWSRQAKIYPAIYGGVIRRYDLIEKKNKIATMKTDINGGETLQSFDVEKYQDLITEAERIGYKRL